MQLKPHSQYNVYYLAAPVLDGNGSVHEKHKIEEQQLQNLFFMATYTFQLEIIFSDDDDEGTQSSMTVL